MNVGPKIGTWQSRYTFTPAPPDAEIKKLKERLAALEAQLAKLTAKKKGGK